MKNGLHRIDGCNQRTEYELLCMGSCVWVQAPVRQASFELNCPQDQLQYMRLSEAQIGVQGCDRRASYVRTCAPGTGCTWLMSTAGAGQQAPASTSEPTPSNSL